MDTTARPVSSEGQPARDSELGPGLVPAATSLGYHAATPDAANVGRIQLD